MWTLPDHLMTLQDHSVTSPYHLGTLPDHLVTLPDHLGMLLDHLETLPDHLVTSPDHLGTLSDHLVTSPDLRPRVGVNLLGLWPRVEAKFLWFCNHNLNLYVPPFCIEVHRGRFRAQNTCISSLLSQFRTFFWPHRPRFDGEMSRQRPDASVDVSGYAFGAILADRWLVFQREIHFLQNTEIRLENTTNTKIGVHHCERRVQRFPWV